MFESTLEAQGLGDGQRRIGALSAAALAHVGVGLAIVAATALVVPKVITPEPPPRPWAVIALPPLDVSPKPPASAPPPPKGARPAKPGSALTPPPVVPDLPPVETPESLPTTEQPTPSEGPETDGDGTIGDSDGSTDGITGATGSGGPGGGGREGSGSDPVEVTGDMIRPKLLVKVEPMYPNVPRRAGLGGRVTLRAVIAENGSVESVEVYASTNPLFNEAAVDAVRQWRYRPASMGGRPIRVYLSVVVDFLVR